MPDISRLCYDEKNIIWDFIPILNKIVLCRTTYCTYAWRLIPSEPKRFVRKGTFMINELLRRFEHITDEQKSFLLAYALRYNAPKLCTFVYNRMTRESLFDISQHVIYTIICMQKELDIYLRLSICVTRESQMHIDYKYVLHNSSKQGLKNLIAISTPGSPMRKYIMYVCEQVFKHGEKHQRYKHAKILNEFAQTPVDPSWYCQ